MEEKRKEYCSVHTDKTVHFRRCFMSGEYCTKQRDITFKRKGLHRTRTERQEDVVEISAFVIMDFSDMSDIVYEWHLKEYIQSLRKYLRYDIKNKKIYCTLNENPQEDEIKKIPQVNKIHVIRADSAPSSNFVICSRICQQLQMADLVVVDLSYKNANVFYELGLAVALDKLILPICYSESFYSDHRSEKEKEEATNNKFASHIGNNLWRKELYEYFGVIYRNPHSHIEYSDINEIKKGIKSSSCSTDVKYTKFPYTEKSTKETEIGSLIYNCLKNGYNTDPKDKPKNNTIVVYTLDKFLNKEDAGRCIINFYNTITSELHNREKSFSGSRIGVLAHYKPIYEENKDSANPIYHTYNIGEIITIGVNNAAYHAFSQEISGRHATNYINSSDQQLRNCAKSIEQYLGKRAILMYPENPVYVDRLDSVQSEILEALEKYATPSHNNEVFCLYHMMLMNLKNVNELVVDITDNSIQNLFWLGIAHGLNVNAVSVLYEQEEEKLKADHPAKGMKKYRNVFDVSGLWTAELTKDDTEGFYKQLLLVQQSMEKQHKLIPDFQDIPSINSSLASSLSIPQETQQREYALLMESYYRRRVWNSLLQYNELEIYLNERLYTSKHNRSHKDRVAAKWDLLAAAAISNYLSKRTSIGKNTLQVVSENNTIPLNSSNNISIGSEIRLNKIALRDYVNDNSRAEGLSIMEYSADIKGFSILKSKADDEDIVNSSSDKQDSENKEQDQQKKIPNIKCQRPSKKDSSCALEYGQLIMWKERSKEDNTKARISISLSGSTGPSTYGLASLFVDEEQKKEFYKLQDESDKRKDYLFLTELQEIIRKKYIQGFINRKLKKEKELVPMENIVRCYLTYVLDKYFLPFHSEKDIYTICNSFEYYLRSLSEEVCDKIFISSPITFSKTSTHNQMTTDSINIITKTIDLLKKDLESFCGIQAFYEMTVLRNEGEKKEIEKPESAIPENGISTTSSKKQSSPIIDSRELKDIHIMEDCFSVLFKKISKDKEL